MRATATSTVAAIVFQDGVKRVAVDPSPKELAAARSVHVLAFTSHDELLLAESEGDFSVKEWDDVYDAAAKICCQSGAGNADTDMDLDGPANAGPDMRQFLSSTLEAKVAADLYWK